MGASLATAGWRFNDRVILPPADSPDDPSKATRPATHDAEDWVSSQSGVLVWWLYWNVAVLKKSTRMANDASTT